MPDDPDWQPIKTFPDDGKPRLVWCPVPKKVFHVTKARGYGFSIFGPGLLLDERPTRWHEPPKPPHEPDLAERIAEMVETRYFDNGFRDNPPCGIAEDIRSVLNEMGVADHD